ncbi:hypothetical protein MSG28_006176, partial [Choristoneura fumiferana]
ELLPWVQALSPSGALGRGRAPSSVPPGAGDGGLVLHFLGQLVRIEQARHRHLHATLLFLGLPQREKPLLQAFPNYELCPLVSPGGMKHEMENVTAERHGDSAGLHQREDVGQDGGVHGEAGAVRGIRDHAEHMLEDVAQLCAACGCCSTFCSSRCRIWRPVSATLRMVCLNAQIIESRTNLNCAGGMLRKALKQLVFTACSSRKNSVRCSGYSSKSLLIISRVHSKTASKIFGTSDVMCPPSAQEQCKILNENLFLVPASRVRVADVGGEPWMGNVNEIDYFNEIKEGTGYGKEWIFFPDGDDIPHFVNLSLPDVLPLSRRIKMVTHGWMSSADKSVIVGIKNAYLAVKDVIVIGVDWSDTAMDLFYPAVAGETGDVGTQLGQFLKAFCTRYDVSGIGYI